MPRPAHRPVEVWQPIVSGTDRAFDFMAKHGIKGVILGTAEQYVEPWMHRYQEANARYGRELELGENLALVLWYYIDASYDKAKKALQPLFEEHVKFAAPLGMLRYTEQQMQATGPAGVATHIAAGTDFDDVLNKRAWFCGTSADTIAYLQKIQEKYPDLEQILIAFPMGSTQAQFKDQLTCLSEEVMPAFQTGKVTA